MTAWEKVALGAVATIERSSVRPEAIQEGMVYVGLEHIGADGALPAPQSLGPDLPASTKFRFTSRHILYGKLRPYLAKIACPNFNGICSTDILPVLPGSRIERRFLFHFLRRPAIVAYANSLAVGVNLPRLSPSALAQFRIPLPPLPEQHRIADILDRAEALRAKRRAALEQLDVLTQSIFFDLFGDPGKNVNGWEIATISEAAECLDRLRKPVKASERTEGPIPYYGANGQQGWIDKALFNEPLVLVAEDGGHFDHPERGVAYRIDGPAWVNNHAHVLRARSERVDVEYLHRALRHYDFTPYISGTTRAKLTQGQMADAGLILPPIALQQEFAHRIDAVANLRTTHRASLAELDALFGTLQHRAFQGKL